MNFSNLPSQGCPVKPGMQSHLYSPIKLTQFEFAGQMLGCWWHSFLSTRNQTKIRQTN